MNRRVVLSASLIAAAILLPDLGFAADKLAGQLDTEINQLIDTIFGYPTKIAVVLGCAYAALTGALSGSYMKAIITVGVGILTLYLPKILRLLFDISEVAS